MCLRSKPFSLLLLVAAFFAATSALAQNGCPLQGAPLVAPADGAIVESPVTLQWGAVPGATRYEVWASVDFNQFEQLGTSTTTSLVADITKGSIVEWYVVAANNDCKSESPHIRFITAGCTGPASTLISPADGGRSSSPAHFFWSGVPGAIGYRLWIAPYPFNDAKDFEVWDETARTESRAFLSPGQYAWLVESIFASCDSNYSYYSVFEVPKATNCSTAVPRILTPAIGSTTKSPVTLSWSAVPGALNYQVWAALDNGEAQFVDETPSASMVVYVGVGHIDWLVIAQFNGCDDAYSDVGSFDVPYDPACDHHAPFPIVPADGANNVPTKADFIWTPVDGASRYNVWASINGSDAYKVGTTTMTRLSATVQVGEIAWAVEAEFDGCSPQLSPVSTFVALSGSACTTPAAPDVYMDPQVSSGDPYYFIWNPGLNTSSFELQESTDPTFASAATRTVSDVLQLFSHQVSTPTRYYYRVRSNSSCDAGVGPYSEVAAIVVQPAVAQTGDRAGTVASYGTQRQVVQQVHIPGSSGTTASAVGAAQGFTATTDEPWLTVTPSTGTIPPEGLDLTITADPRRLPMGTNTATLHVSTTASAGTPTSVPISISLVTPVSPDAGTSPLPNSLIIPAVGHAAGAGTTFESDVRITNASAQAMKYLLNFTPTRSDGTKVGQQANLQIEAGDTTALNDIMKNFFGFATASDSILGVLEIRPVSSVSGASNPGTQSNATVASSRTFAVTPEGTYGQYIPAIPFSSFIAKDSTVSLQQIAETSRYHTNIGLVEAAGENATVLLTIRDASGTVVSQFEKTLKPGEHQQFPNTVPVENGRIEATVTSPTGKVTAYASVLDQQTHDPMLIMPVNTANVSASRYILPGIAQSTGNSNWRSDVRLFNAGTSAVPATITYYEQGNAEPRSVTRTVNPGQMLVFDEALQSLFGLASSAGGALLVTTPSDSKLVASARTYNVTPKGTYGQFVPGVTAAEGVGVNDRALQVLQVEKSDRFHTNLGIVELTGKPVTVQISAYTPNSKISVNIEWALGPNEFVQLNDILLRLNMPNAYNARISLKVIAGDGRISGYGSLIDERTSDPTYIPAQ